jgi:hypothetical protein
VHHVDASHHLEKLAGHVARSRDSRRSYADFARIGFGVGNQLRKCSPIRTNGHSWRTCVA